MSHQYTRFLEILKKWPVEEARGTHCFGNHLRKSSSLWFSADGRVIGSTEVNEQRLISLERLINNHYKEKYPTPKVKTVTGMNEHECKETLISDFQESDGLLKSLVSKVLSAKKDQK